MYIGNHDNPVKSIIMDKLAMEAQVEGLAQFIQNCETPLTISIQGSWGTGKTSFVNLVKESIFSNSDNKDDYVFIPFNSWQFVQFDMSEQLSSNLIVAITKELGKTIKTEEAKKPVLDIINGMEVLKSTGRLGVLAANNYIKEKLNVDVKQTLDDVGFTDTEKIFKQTKDTMTAIDTISGLRKNLQKTIDASLGITEEMRKNSNTKEFAEKLRKKRVIIFVDDLDRLTPDKAIEVLEVLKMFLDCEHCVFLLAIDYDVVVNGVTIKYRNSITEEKGRDFFEKMIQVVYTLPSTMNHTDKFIADLLVSNGQNISLAYDFAELVKKGNKDNPRAIKRLLNSYFLLDMMKKSYYKEEQNQAEAVLQFAVLCLQNICPEIYNCFSEQFAGTFHYEKGVKWFNTLHKYFYEMSEHASSSVKIRDERLEQWNLFKSDKRIDRMKIAFLCSFFDKLEGTAFFKQASGNQLNIHEILCLKKAIQWNNLVQGKYCGHSYLDNIAKINVAGRDIETHLGTIQEAYELTIAGMLEYLLREDRIDEFDSTIGLFNYILSPKAKDEPKWKEINVLGKKVWLKTEFAEEEEDIRLDVVVNIAQLVSKYTQITFTWYKDRRGKEVFEKGYDSQEGKIFVDEVSFITVDGYTRQIPKRGVEKAYVETIRRILECLDAEKVKDCMEKFPAMIKYDFDMVNDNGDEDIEQAFDPAIFENLEDLFSNRGNISAEADKPVNISEDDLDEISPLEYLDEFDRRLSEIVEYENENGWYDYQKPVNGWRKEALCVNGGQIDIKVNVGIQPKAAIMAMNVYKLSKYTGVDFVWYRDAYMKEIVNRGPVKDNDVLRYLKYNCLSRVYHKKPELFQKPDLYFYEDTFGSEQYKLDEED